MVDEHARFQGVSCGKTRDVSSEAFNRRCADSNRRQRVQTAARAPAERRSLPRAVNGGRYA